MPTATATTRTVDNGLRSRLAVTCPDRIAGPGTFRDRNRSMMPPVMSRQTVTAVMAAPVTAHSSSTPGTT